MHPRITGIAVVEITISRTDNLDNELVALGIEPILNYEPSFNRFTANRTNIIRVLHCE